MRLAAKIFVKLRWLFLVTNHWRTWCERFLVISHWWKIPSIKLVCCLCVTVRRVELGFPFLLDTQDGSRWYKMVWSPQSCAFPMFNRPRAAVSSGPLSFLWNVWWDLNFTSTISHEVELHSGICTNLMWTSRRRKWQSHQFAAETASVSFCRGHAKSNKSS